MTGQQPAKWIKLTEEGLSRSYGKCALELWPIMYDVWYNTIIFLYSTSEKKGKLYSHPQQLRFCYADSIAAA